MKIEQCQRWTSEARAGIARCLPAREGHVGRRVDAGEINLWRIDDGRVWVATETEGDALIVHALEGRDTGGVIAAIIASARAQGFAEVRFRTHRKGMGRFMGRYGFRYDGEDADAGEVYRKALM